MDKHPCSPEAAVRMLQWIRTRGGLAVWKSINLSNPGASWTTPVNTVEGTPYLRPNWQAEEKPSRIITDAAEVEVVISKELRRFRVAVRRGGGGLAFKCTDASTVKIHEALASAGAGAWYDFDYSTQECVIFGPDEVVPLLDYCRKLEAAV